MIHIQRGRAQIETELWRLSAVAIAQAIREKRASIREVIQAHLDRIEAENGRVNAVTVVLSKDALDARRADQVVSAGAALGALHGVPITVKEDIDLAGSATTHGVVGMEDSVPSVDAPSGAPKWE